MTQFPYLPVCSAKTNNLEKIFFEFRLLVIFCLQIREFLFFSSLTKMSEMKMPANQDLESLCYLETMFQEYGFDDGFRDGEKSGELEGRLFGCEKAYDLAKEIGFYSGCIDMWEQLQQSYPDTVPSK
jgi:hypothetical protein